jgi:hypothetical protein
VEVVWQEAVGDHANGMPLGVAGPQSQEEAAILGRVEDGLSVNAAVEIWGSIRPRETVFLGTAFNPPSHDGWSRNPALAQV